MHCQTDLLDSLLESSNKLVLNLLGAEQVVWGDACLAQVDQLGPHQPVHCLLHVSRAGDHCLQQKISMENYNPNYTNLAKISAANIFRPVDIHRAFATELQGNRSQVFISCSPDNLANRGAPSEEDVVKTLPQ